MICLLLTAIKYNVQGYSVRQDFLHRNYFPLLAIFLSWSGFGSPYASNIVQTTLSEHFSLDPTRVCDLKFTGGELIVHICILQLRMKSRALKAGNNRPSVMNPEFKWLAKLKYEGNMLIFINSHSDTATGNLIVAGNDQNPQSVPIHEVRMGVITFHARTK
jgi:hypothetical protein